MEIIPRLETPRPNLRAIFCLLVIYRVGGTAVIDAVQLKSARAADCDGYDVFYDHGTEYCEFCSEICQNAEVQGTQEQCRQNCPRYLRAMRCEKKEGWVYDQAEDSCRSCCDVCDASKPDISLQCMRLCPDYFAGRTKASSPNSSSHGHGEANGPSSYRLLPCAGNSTEKNPSHSSATEDHVIWITIVIIIIVVILGVVVILFARGIVSRFAPSKMRVLALRPVRPHESEGEADFNDRGEDVAIPIEESKAAAAEQPCLAVVSGDASGRSMMLRVVTAFADLSVGRNPSRLYQIV